MSENSDQLAELESMGVVEEIKKILANADLAKTSCKKVRQQLEKKFDTDLFKHRDVIAKLVRDHVDSMYAAEDGSEDSSDEEDNEPVAKVRKVQKAEPKPSASESSENSDNSDSDDHSKKKKKSSKDEDWGASKKKGATPKSAKKGGRGGGKAGKGSGYTRPYKLSPALAELMGQDAMPRHEVVRRMWAIIKERNLYDPNNKQFAICDKSLLKVFGTNRFRTFGMMKYLKNHFIDG